MSRFDPYSYPDRLEFEAYVHRIRARELGELFHAVGAREKVRLHETMSRLRKFATTTFSHVHPHSTH